MYPDRSTAQSPIDIPKQLGVKASCLRAHHPKNDHKWFGFQPSGDHRVLIDTGNFMGELREPIKFIRIEFSYEQLV